ncbi:MAG: hypothetical protein ACRD45_08115 [Bryobacteraceae bacterium]
MGNYISSNANRFYVSLEQSYGQAVAASAANRFPAIQLQAQQILQYGKRLDKTGSRTFLGAPKSARRQTAFQVHTYLTSWTGLGQPSYGPLFQGGLGAQPILSSGLVVASVIGPAQLEFTTPHGLSRGSAVGFENEIRFVTAAPTAEQITINAPFLTTPGPTAALAPAASYGLSTMLPSVTLYDYWDPAAIVSRIVTGAGVDTLDVSVNGDYHEFAFSGPACDLLDSSSFLPGSAGLSAFPAEPQIASFDYSIVPGQLGEVWLGSALSQFYTLTEATVQVKNNIDVRDREFGSSYPRALAPGAREIIAALSIFTQDDTQTTSLYAAAKQRTQISAMLQLGRQQGEILGIYLPSITPEIPRYNDTETRLQWQFRNNLAQGTAEDEIYFAFA